MTKEYTSGEVTIVWKPEICIHSEKCWRGLSFVFDPKSKPWINADGAPTDEIISQVSQCPSGALTSYLNAEVPSESSASEAIQIQFVQNGPAIVRGPCEIALNNGTTKTVEESMALCRCGASTNKPFCDGSHIKIGFIAE
ncbi:MAG: putative Fe-S cluster protein YjdI [Flavobacteriales bacterium]|jgi:uncharacterized Fe-S cluster protein YjdI